jgi:hypothetical protein
MGNTVSSVIFQILKDKGLRHTFESSIRKMILVLAGFAYVDDYKNVDGFYWSDGRDSSALKMLVVSRYISIQMRTMESMCAKERA